jgi:Pentapeptide repeats (8 copies)
MEDEENRLALIHAMLHTSPRREESRVDQEGKDGQQQQSGGLWAAGIFWVALGFLLNVLGGYVHEWEWAGLVVDTNYPRKTFWDWLDLLIVPAVLALGGYLFTRSESRRTQETANKERTLDRELADERRQDDALQAYLDGMSQLLTDKEMPLHRAQPGDSLSTVARARTRTVLGRLDSARKRHVLQFLFESKLIFKRRHNIVSLQQADLSGADLREANLIRANLLEADLSEARLYRGNLREADLREANLIRADLRDADLIRALSASHADFRDMCTGELPRTPYPRSSQNSTSRHLGE